ncbi:hypothetical protein [Halorhodospira sp. 9622]|uniref:hypothetical protein n=1 Tax=Halorhodospira sp. 9622 TaxID=2899136 RepID=UPI001EE88047|nr:hypothetical protein [Halorhodospira sp. 9622]MCG5538890.1 hypothetical protein [Halorhodospira sp. 9622]
MRHGFRHIGGAVVCSVVAVLLFFPAAPVMAQGFNVQPMMLEAAPRPGQTIELPLRLNNTSPTGDQMIELRLVELTQAPTGSWYVVNPGSGEGPPHDASLLDWVSLEEDSITVPAAGRVETTVNVNVPRDAHGAYFGALIAETPRPADAQGLVVRVRFLIPIIMQTQGRSVRQQVRIDDVMMTYDVDEEDRRDPTTLAKLSITNQGRTYSRVQGRITVDRESNDRWRPVTRIDVPERSIIPGVTFSLGDDLERRLPSGTYRLRGELRVDGRSADILEKVVEFEGDPSIDTLAYDTALVLDPVMVQMNVSPGATRTAVVSIANPGEDAVTVQMAASTPNDLRGVAMGDLRGDAFSAEGWTEIRPSEFTLRPNGQRNVRVISRIPREGLDHSNYYADLILQGRYADGQSAGETRSVAHLVHSGVETAPEGAIERLLIAEGDEPSEHIIQVRFANRGDVHLEPSGEVQVLSGRGSLARARLTAEPGPILPLGRRNFGGKLDFSEVEPGYYALRASLGYGFQLSASEQTLIEVIAEPDENGSMVHRVRVLDDDADIDLPDEEALPELEGAVEETAPEESQ